MKNYELRITNYKLPFAKILCVFSFLCAAVFSVDAQSVNQNFPTPVSTSEIDGRIPARDVGDARLTTYFFTFDGTQGDVFINVKTANLDGDIDVFTRDNLRPLTKITVFADAPASETGRVFYLRKPEKLILRIQGKTPNDEAATFNLRFAGSFVPIQATAENDLPDLPEIKTGNQTDVLVNSVGTIIEVKPKPAALPEETVAVNEPETGTTGATSAKPAKTNPRRKPARTPRGRTTKKSAESSPITTIEAETKEVSEINPEAEKSAVKTPAPNNKRRTRQNAASKNATENKKSTEANPLETVRLIIELKDGTKIERVMSEVLRVGVDKAGTLTLVTKDGKISRYSILDVARMTIE